MISPPPRSLGFDALWQSLTVRPLLLTFGLLLGLVGTIQFVVFTLIFSTLFESLLGPDLTNLRKTGTITTGEVINTQEITNTTINGAHPYRVDFSYDRQGERKLGSMRSLDRRIIRSWEPGTRVNVKYLDDQAVITDISPVEFPAFLKFIPLFFVPVAMVGLICLFIALFSARRKHQLFKHGELRDAEFRAVEGQIIDPGTPQKIFGFPILMRTHNSFKPRVTINYAYRDSFDRECIGSSLSTDQTIARDLKRGDPIRILVLPTNEHISTILDTPAERALTNR